MSKDREKDRLTPVNLNMKRQEALKVANSLSNKAVEKTCNWSSLNKMNKIRN